MCYMLVSNLKVTQEVLLAKHVVIAVCFEARRLLSLARKFALQ
jgi:hypothetical protein